MLNEFGQQVGASLPAWSPRELPPRTVMHGRFCQVAPLDAAVHGPGLWRAFARDADARRWTYLPYGPFVDAAGFLAWLKSVAGAADPLFHTIMDTVDGAPVGVASYLRIEPRHGCIEVGHLNFSALMQRRPLATEAMYLMMRRVFDELGYRRYEWKCDALNAPSRAAALRLGFTFEGIFRQAVVVKGRNRDTAWYSMTDAEWPALRARFERWLAAENFGADGTQIRALAEA